MTKTEAQCLVGNKSHFAIYNMAKELSSKFWRNTDEDWRRLEAAVMVLGRNAPECARIVLKARLEGLK
jgi:hypothetical protein